MTNFLILLHANGLIKDIVWCNPVHIMFMLDDLFINYFNEKDKQLLSKQLTQAQLHKHAYYKRHSYEIRFLQIKVDLIFMHSNNNTYVFGFDIDEITKNGDDTQIKTYQNFLETLCLSNQNNSAFSLEANTSTLEKIQSLNNELINAHRLLEKLNAQLNTTNQFLNSRLVKDELTGLISRFQYQAEIERSIQTNKDLFGIFAFIDIDNFKRVNDTYGHKIGDAYLIEFAQRLRKMPNENMLHIRISGDEFGLYDHAYAEHDIQKQILKLWADLLEYVVHTPIMLKDKYIPISISVGFAVYGKDTDNIYKLIDYADYAMYQVKNAGKNGYQVFNLQTTIETEKEDSIQ